MCRMIFPGCVAATRFLTTPLSNQGVVIRIGWLCWHSKRWMLTNLREVKIIFSLCTQSSNIYVIIYFDNQSHECSTAKHRKGNITTRAKQSTIHILLEPFSEFWLEPGTPLVQVAHMDPIWLEFAIGMLLDLGPPEIWAPGPPWCPLGPKNFRQNFSHIIKIRCYFMYFVDLFWRKCGE